MAIDNTNEELLGSQRRGAKKICSPKIIKRFLTSTRNTSAQEGTVKVNNLNV